MYPKIPKCRLYTKKKLCKKLDIDEDTLARWIEDYGFPKGFRIGDMEYWDWNDVNLWAHKIIQAQRYGRPPRS